MVLAFIEHTLAVFDFDSEGIASMDPATATRDDGGIGGAGEIMPQNRTPIDAE